MGGFLFYCHVLLHLGCWSIIVDFELVTDRLEAIPFVFFVPHAFVVRDAGVRLPAFKFLAGGTVVRFIVRVGVTAPSTGRRPLLLLLLVLLLALFLLAMPVLGVGLARGVALAV